MAESVARIRRYEAKDEKEVRFVIARAAVEGLAEANIKTIINPVSISLWILLAGLIIQYMNWWPKQDEGILPYISLMLPLGSAAVPIIVFSDWKNRPYFDQLSERILHGPDMVGLEQFYTKSPQSAIWILEYAGRLVGLVAVDASSDSQVDTISSANKTTKSTRKTSETAAIRHIFVDEQYRSTGVQDDLVDYALQNVFTPDSSVIRVKASSSPLRAYAEKALTEAGFKFEGVTETIGLLKWKVSSRVITKDEWESRRK